MTTILTGGVAVAVTVAATLLVLILQVDSIFTREARRQVKPWVSRRDMLAVAVMFFFMAMDVVILRFKFL